MDRRDRRALPIAVAATVSLVLAAVVGLVVQLPGGAFDMRGLGLIALAGVASFLIGLGVAMVLRQRL